MSSLSALNHAAQVQAAGLHAQLSKLLGPAASAPPADTPSDATTAPEQQQQQLALHHLQSLAVASAALGRALATAHSSRQQQQLQQPGTSEEQEEAQEAYSRREQLLGDLLQLLDSSAQSLRSQLDSCHKLLDTKPCMEDPEQIIRYAHTLRYGFAPLGSTPGLWQVPPAPQIPFMLHSTLRQYHMELAAQQQQQDATQLSQEQHQQQQVQLPPPGMAGAALQQQEGAAAAAQQQQQAPEQQQQQPMPRAISFQLNQDLEEEPDMETASEEEMSEEDYSDN
jgi:hypothetical protein